MTQSGNTFSAIYNTGSLETVLGSPSAFVGFTGSDGGGTSTQTVSGFSFASGPAAVPEASTTVSFGLLLAIGLAGLAAVRRKQMAQ